MDVSRRHLLAAAGLGLAPALVPSVARAASTADKNAPRIGMAAPAFTATDSDGAMVRLADLRNRIVVLEWTNDGCPFVAKWYATGAMQGLQREAASLGAVWLQVISSAPGEQGYADGARANELMRAANGAPNKILLDPRGSLGRLYGAQTTPHMYIIGADGKLAYMGGADSIASTRTEDLATAEPFFRNALVAVHADRPVARAVTRAYGCSIKYAPEEA